MALSHAMRHRTSAHQLADIKAGGALDDEVAQLLAADVSYPAIARLLLNKYGITVSDETLRRWYPKKQETAA